MIHTDQCASVPESDFAMLDDSQGHAASCSLDFVSVMLTILSSCKSSRKKNAKTTVGYNRGPLALFPLLYSHDATSMPSQGAWGSRQVIPSTILNSIKQVSVRFTVPLGLGTQPSYWSMSVRVVRGNVYLSLDIPTEIQTKSCALHYGFTLVMPSLFKCVYSVCALPFFPKHKLMHSA